MIPASWQTPAEREEAERTGIQPICTPTTAKPYFPVVDYAAIWYAPVAYRDTYTGEITEDTAEEGRYFSGDRHADPHKAAMRWARLMAWRHGHAWLRCYLDGVADVCDVAVKPEPPQ